MEAGDFHASTGVRLHDIQFDGREFKIAIEPEKGVTYTTQFIGTRRGFDPTSHEVLDPESDPDTDPSGNRPVTRRYSDKIGEVLAEVEGLTPDYTLQGDELYAHAKIISSKPKMYPSEQGESEVAWTQPVTPTPR